MSTDLVWACPRCGNPMERAEPAKLQSWHCPSRGCGFDWVSGEALAAFVPNVNIFAKLRDDAASGEAPMRPLQCPTCRTGSLRVVKAAGVTADVCPKCGGAALDPGELRKFESIRHTATTRAESALDIVSSVDVLASILKDFC